MVCPPFIAVQESQTRNVQLKRDLEHISQAAIQNPLTTIQEREQRAARECSYCSKIDELSKLVVERQELQIWQKDVALGELQQDQLKESLLSHFFSSFHSKSQSYVQSDGVETMCIDLINID
jgi:hypothetical protein